MKILVILGHPDPGSFNHAVAAAVCHALKKTGHTVTFHDPLENFWGKSTLGACGVKTVKRKNLGGVIFSDNQTRENWLDEVTKTVRQLFPAG